MTTVLIQAGHSPQFTPYRAGGGGAPGEADWTGRLALRLQGYLDRLGVPSEIVGSWMAFSQVYPAPPVAKLAYGLAIMCHYDANIYGTGGGFIDRYRPEAWGRPPTGGREVEERFMALWEQHYFPITGIKNMPQRRNPNTNDYYAYRDLTNPTPRVLIEFGVGAPGAPDWNELWNHMDRVAASTAAAVAELFGLVPVVPDGEEYGMPAISREEAKQKLEQLGFLLPDGFAITERAIESARVNGGKEWRGPAISDEYLYDTGHVRRDFTAGTLDYDPATGEANWAEVVKESRE